VLQTVPPSGLATNYAYSISSSGGQVVTTTLPSGSTTIREQYTDRRLKSQTGTGVVSEFHIYSTDSLTNDPPPDALIGIGLVDTVTWGAPGSQRVTVNASDDVGRPCLVRKYDFDALPSHRKLKKMVGNSQKTCHTAG